MTDKKSRRTDWLFSLASLALIILILIVAPAWFWVPLPFFLTFLVKAVDSM